MKIEVSLGNVEYFDDGQNWRYSGSFTVNGQETAVAAGTSNLEDKVVAAIETVAGRALTDSEVVTISDDIYSVTDFEMTLD